MIQLSFAFLSTAWAAVAAALVDHPALQPSLDVTPETCMAITGAFVATNFLVSLSELTFRGRIAVVASLAQIPLFCVLHVQLFNLDPSGYAFESPPHWLDWIVLTAVHLARAVDILDAIDEPGKLDLGFLNLEAVGLAPRLLMVWMHLSIDLFVGSFLGNWLASRYLRSPAPCACVPANRDVTAGFSPIGGETASASSVSGASPRWAASRWSSAVRSDNDGRWRIAFSGRWPTRSRQSTSRTCVRPSTGGCIMWITVNGFPG